MHKNDFVKQSLGIEKEIKNILHMKTSLGYERKSRILQALFPFSRLPKGAPTAELFSLILFSLFSMFFIFFSLLAIPWPPNSS